MTILRDEYKNTVVIIDTLPLLADRIRELSNQVLMKLPDEEQFEMSGRINCVSRQQAIEYWDKTNPIIGTSTDVRLLNRDGNCTHLINETIEHSRFYITIIVDDLESKPDDYIKGLFAHEISEMSYIWRAVQDEKKNLKKLKPKARQVRMNQITKQDAAIMMKCPFPSIVISFAMISIPPVTLPFNTQVLVDVCHVPIDEQLVPSSESIMASAWCIPKTRLENITNDMIVIEILLSALVTNLSVKQS